MAASGWCAARGARPCAQQFGLITALTIVYSLIAAVLIEPACLKLWADRQPPRERHGHPSGVEDLWRDVDARDLAVQFGMLVLPAAIRSAWARLLVLPVS